ncbi:hypothetical protein V6U90_23890 [Micromonospora sp. CPCC 206060]|uniref:hypothetical protein n=1 Tax=Micromonospora sp. CPCC 206060 TaxID=3122406 RepID=UPI002FF0D245
MMWSDERIGASRLRWRASALTAGLATLLAGALAGPLSTASAPASAGPVGTLATEVTATVWAHSPTTAEYQITGGYTVNSTGNPVTIRRTSVGAYTVVLEGAATSGGVAHVVAYGGGPVHCTVAAWGRSLSGVDQEIVVRCFAATGAAVDSRFVATYTNVRQISQGRLAYFWTDQAAPTGVRTITHSYRYDSTGGPISYERLGTGHYRFHINRNPDSEYGAPIFPMTHVTAYATSAVHCQTGRPDSRDVWCVNAAGNPVDSRFTVTYGSRVDLLGRSTGPRFASGTLYRDTVRDGRIFGDSYNSTLPGYGGASGTVFGTGQYTMTFTGTATPFGTAFVNAHRGMFDSDPRGHCVLAGWSSLGSDTQIRVNCYRYLGVPANLDARVSFTTWPAA